LTLTGGASAEDSAGPIAVTVAATAERYGLNHEISDARVEHSTTSHTLAQPVSPFRERPARLNRTVSAPSYRDHVTIREPDVTSREPFAPAATVPSAVQAAAIPPGPVYPLARISFVVVDVETTGWHPEESGITEIGAVRFGSGLPEAEYSALVNPGAPIPDSITELTGITDSMVRQAPPVAAVMPGFLAFARGCVVAAHNAPFDIGFLTAACSSARLPWPAFQVVDTAALARTVLDETEVPDCKLATLAGFFGTRVRPCHRALADARATTEVLRALLGRLQSTGVQTLAEISA
jgi:DNA polymerase III epsilon subunit family exonuclease